ncbi:MAG TPA: hypothetical protein VNQ50_00855 [Xanthobacteraceae bacterium]|jgi:hypothetical protein|nr:hypothetical protein [Xanthobacteraceae bacterium]
MTAQAHSQDSTVRALTLQLLEWVAERPRSYEEVMNAWRTSCPRLPVWEEAVSQGFVRRQSHQSLRNATVIVTDAGRRFLRAAQPPAHLTASDDPSFSRKMDARIESVHGDE